MNAGFFNKSEVTVVSSNHNRSRRCGACKLYKTCKSPKMKAVGKGEKGILIIAEAPGSLEDKRGEMLVGRPGKYLTKMLSNLGINVLNDCRKINAVNCHPPKGAKPTDLQVECCRPMILKEIKRMKPKLIILLGTAAVKSVYGHRWKKGLGGIEKWRGWNIPDRELNTWVCPAFHPAFISKKDVNPAGEVIFERDLRKAIRKSKQELPYFKDEESCVEIIKRPSKIRKRLESVCSLMQDGLFSFDYETTGLKPQAKGHEIVCCSIATSREDVFSFPIYEENNLLLRRILENQKFKKSAHNMKFENIWSYFILQATVKGWGWDSQLAAHILDNRQGITPLKFQALINFGITDYDSHISDYLRGVDEKNANSFNRIKELPIDDVLLYCGMDSLIGYRLTEKQMPEVQKKYPEAYKLFHEGNLSLAQAEKTGMAVDEEYCHKKDKHLGRQIARLEEKIKNSPETKIWKKTFRGNVNFESGDQLATILFDKDKMGLKAEKKTENGNPSVDQDALEALNIPFVNDILELRKTRKVKSTYFGGYIRESIDGVLRPYFHLNIPRTYRSSSSNINFQNQPNRDAKIKKLCRRAIVARLNRMILAGDYGGLEVKIAACYHKDPVMLKYLNDPKTDMHRDQAMEIYCLEQDQVIKSSRYCAKNGFVFPQFYGDYYGNNAESCWGNITKMNLTTKSGVDMFTHLKKHGITSFDKFLNHMKAVEDRFWNEKFTVYQQWKDEWVTEYHEKGYCDSLTGFRFQGLIERNQVINYPVQGAAFHSLVWAINKIVELTEGWESKFIGQIHDEKVDEVHPEEFNDLVKLSTRVMCEDIKKAWDWIIVPLEAEFEVSPINGSFYDKKAIHYFKCRCGIEYCWKDEIYEVEIHKANKYTCPICSKKTIIDIQ